MANVSFHVNTNTCPDSYRDIPHEEGDLSLVMNGSCRGVWYGNGSTANQIANYCEPKISASLKTSSFINYMGKNNIWIIINGVQNSTNYFSRVGTSIAFPKYATYGTGSTNVGYYYLYGSATMIQTGESTYTMAAPYLMFESTLGSSGYSNPTIKWLNSSGGTVTPLNSTSIYVVGIDY